MVPFESNHNMTAKMLLPVNGTAVTLPAGQSAENDLSGALDNIFAQPSLPPFVCKQLIQHLVTSNPEQRLRQTRRRCVCQRQPSAEEASPSVPGSAATCKP